MQREVKHLTGQKQASLKAVLKNAGFAWDQLINTRLIIGKSYLLVQQMFCSQKMRTYKGINLTTLPFTWCLIKQGFADIPIDQFGRNGSDHLLWQKTVMHSLQDYVSMPRYMDFIPHDGADFLITEFVSGEKLSAVINRCVAGKKWCFLYLEIRIRLLRYYLDVVGLVENIHAKGFVHRSITPDHFIVRPQRKIAVLEVSQAYSLNYGMPDPPFPSAEPGYTAPEMAQDRPPTFEDDIYSLGALFVFMTTGVCPSRIAGTATSEEIRARLFSETNDPALALVISSCLSSRPEDRPLLHEVKYEIVHALHELIFNREQNGPEEQRLDSQPVFLNLIDAASLENHISSSI